MKPAPARRSPAAPRARLREWVAVLVVISVVLAGCAETAPPGSGDPDASASPQASSMATGGAPAATHGPWGAYGTQEEACAGLGADVVTLSLLSSSLPVSRRVADVQEVEDEVEAMLEAAPPALVSHYARIQLAIDSYGEDLATPSPSATASPEEPRFDEQALEESLEQIRTWLTETCQRRR